MKKTDKMQHIRELYAEFLREPNSQARLAKGLPPTKAAFVRLHKIDRSTVWHWEQDPDFMRLVSNQALGLVTVDEYMTIINALKEKAMGGNIQAIQTLFKWVNVGMEDREPAVDMPKDMQSKSDEELEAILAAEDAEENATCLTTLPQTSQDMS